MATSNSFCAQVMLLFFPSTAFVATRALPPRRVQPRRMQPLLLEEPEVPPIVDPIIDGTHSERDNGEPSTVTTESGERSDRHGAKEIVKGALQAVKEDTKSAAKVVKEKLAALTGTGTAALSGASPSSSPVAAAPAADSAAGEEDDLTKEREDAVGDRLNKLSDAPISTETYLNSLSRFADDGRRLLNAPQRYSSKDWFANLRSMPRCQLLRAVRGQLAAQCLWALLVALVYIWLPKLPFLPALPHSLLGGCLGVLLGFRTNQSYDRFWEGRKLWGRIFDLSRTMARSMYAYIDGDAELLERVRSPFRGPQCGPRAPALSIRGPLASAPRVRRCFATSKPSRSHSSSTCGASARSPSSQGRSRPRR